MNWLDTMKQFLGGKSTSSVEKLTIGEINEQLIRFEEEENRTIKKLKKLEAEKTELFRLGSAKESEREKMVFVRKIKQTDQEAKILDLNLNRLSKNISFFQNIRWIKENEKQVKEQGAWSTILKMDPEELDKWITEQRVQISIIDEQLDRLNDKLSPEDALFEKSSISNEDRAILEVMEKAGETGMITEGLTEIDSILRQPERDNT